LVTAHTAILADVGRPIQQFFSNGNGLRRLLWVSGQSGCGKTTLGQQLHARAGFVHFDGDVFANGGEPEAFSGIPTAEMLANVDPKIKGA
jgi:hypothetical protein